MLHDCTYPREHEVVKAWVMRVLASVMSTSLLCAACMAQSGEESALEEKLDARRNAMVDNFTLPKPLGQFDPLKKHRISDTRVIDAMRAVKRHLYIPEPYRARVDPYGDHPCPIGFDQTISQPFIVAHMTERMKIQEGEKVLEIGTGSGYQAAILAELGADVYSIEIIPQLAEHARRVLSDQGYGNVHVLSGDGYKGWPQHAPFDAIIVTCAPENVPDALVEQLKDNGRMIVPVGSRSQRLVILRKEEGQLKQEDDIMVRFVPMVHGESKKE